MSSFKKPSELVVRPTFKALIYGEPGIGKSTLALSSPNPVLFDFDGGVNRVNSAFQCPTLQIADEVVTDGSHIDPSTGRFKFGYYINAYGQPVKMAWASVLEALNELASGGVPCDTIVIDTAGKMLDFMADFIIRTDTSSKKLMRRSDGELSMQGYGERKRQFIAFLKKCSMMNKHIIFVAHAKEEKKKKGNEDFVYSRPDIGGSSFGDLIKEMDLVGYAKADGYNRVIMWNPSDEFYAKNACNLQSPMTIPSVIDNAGNIIMNNVMMASLFGKFTQYLVTQRDIRAKYDSIIQRANELIASVNDADAANELNDKFANAKGIWDSVIKTTTLLNTHCVSHGMKFNQQTGKYEAA